MKYVILALVAVLVAMNARLFWTQRQLQQQVAALQAQNSALNEEIAARPTTESFQAVQARLDKASHVMDAVENRLTNATAVLNTLQSHANATRPGTTAPGASGPGALTGSTDPRTFVSGSFRSGPGVLQPIEAALYQPQLQLSSSHSADGQLQRRNWGPEQVLGPPDTPTAGDIPTAWAPLSSRGGSEWLHVNYDRPVDISEINVRETHNPGAISKVAAVLADGREVVIWEGVEPPAQAPVNMSFTAHQGVQAQSVKVYLERTRVPGWNEIDAVELVGRDGTRQWATSASASSSFAEPRSNLAER